MGIPRGRRAAAVCTLGVFYGALAVLVLSSGPDGDEVNVGHGRTLLESVDGLDVLVEQLPGPADNPNVVHLEVGLLRPERRMPVHAAEFAIESSAFVVGGERSDWASCRPARSGVPAWRCAYVVDAPGVWHMDLRVTRRTSGADAVPLGTVEAVVDVPDAVTLSNLSVGARPDPEGIPGTWAFAGLGLVALGAGLGVRVLVRRRG
jgi:hypothetical protein